MQITKYLKPLRRGACAKSPVDLKSLKTGDIVIDRRTGQKAQVIAVLPGKITYRYEAKRLLRACPGAKTPFLGSQYSMLPTGFAAYFDKLN